jgi:hypothetical protein
VLQSQWCRVNEAAGRAGRFLARNRLRALSFSYLVPAGLRMNRMRKPPLAFLNYLFFSMQLFLPHQREDRNRTSYLGRTDCT